MNYSKLQSSASIPAVVTGGWLAKQTPERQLAALVAVAARQATLGRLNHKHLAAVAGLTAHQFREARKQRGAPIRAKKRRISVVLPAPAIPPVTAASVSVSPTKLPTAQQVADLIAALRPLGSQNLFNAALVAEHDEHQAARRLNGGAPAHTR
jgi:hypothetical protein